MTKKGISIILIGIILARYSAEYYCYDNDI